jgi:hypothetical protein
MRIVRPSLSNHGFSHHQIEQVEAAFHSSLSHDPDHPDWAAGIDAKALDATIGYMRKHPDATAIGPHHWDTVREVMMKHI